MRTCDEEGCPKPHRARGLCTMHWKRKYGTRKQYPITCTVCGADHMSARPDGKYCSAACKGTSQRKIPSTALVPWKPAPRGVPAPPPPLRPIRKRWYAGTCRRCETPFISDQPRNRYCSRACLRADFKAKRRALQRDAFVAAVYRARVFERDKWTCQICHRKVNRDAVAPHPRAPVLDHVIPLAAGGTHEPANVQCAHFLCNSIKGKRGGGEQLLLVG